LIGSSRGSKIVLASYSVQKVPVEMNMVARRFAVVVIMGAGLGLSSGAHGRSAYDGSWNVAVYGQSGSCQGGLFQFSVQIMNGSIRYVGSDANVSGRVSSGGAVSVSIVTGDSSAMGSGRLSGNNGSGTYRGQSSTGLCTGTWTGQRTSP
jgi:hypothetical protein